MKQLTAAQEEEIRRSAGKESPQDLAKRLGLSRKRVEQALSEVRPAAAAAGGIARGGDRVVLFVGAMLVLVLGWFAHAPGLDGRDFHFDDTHALRDNQAIKFLHRKVELETRTDLGSGGRLKRLLWALGPTAREIVAYNPYRQVTYWSCALSYLDHPFDRSATPEELVGHLRGWHATNLRIHLLNALLAGWVAWLTLSAPALRSTRWARHPAAVAVVCALIFATHPLQTQAVAYLSQRAESLCASFYLLALGLYATARLRALEGARRGTAPWLTPMLLGGAGAAVVLLCVLAMTAALDLGGLAGWGLLVGLLTAGGLVALVKTGRDEPVHACAQAGCFLAFGLALQSKEVGATIPLALVAWDLLFVPAALIVPGVTPPPGRWWGPRAVRTGLLVRARDLGPWALAVVGVGLLLAAIGGKNIAAQLLAGDVEEGGRALGATVSAPEYLLTQANVLATYVRLFLLPYGQALDWDYPVVTLSAGDGHLWLALLSGALWVGALALLVRRGGRARVACFAFLFGLVVLAPTSSLIVLPDVIYEHRFYLPLMGVALLVGVLFERAAGAWVPPRLQSRALLGAGVLLAVVLGGLSRARNRVWETELSLWADATRKAPEKPRPWTNYGLALMNAEELAVEFDAPDGKRRQVRGSLIELPEGARIVYCVSAPDQQPLVLPERSIAGVKPLGGGAEGARAAFDKALALDPHYTKALNNLALVALSQGGARRVEAQVLRRMAANARRRGEPPERVAPVEERATRSEEAARGYFHEAEQALLRSLEVRPDDAVLLSNLGNIYILYLIDLDRAFEYLTRSYQVKDGPQVARLQAGDILMRKALDAWRAAPAGDTAAARAAARPLWEQARDLYASYLKSRDAAEPFRTVAQRHLADVERALKGGIDDPGAITPELYPGAEQREQ